ncbi:MAG: hypothetical protein IJU81_03935 [Bacteroidales bacterium]|nr:hypothetical protein [Bacteroidales bacterium]
MPSITKFHSISKKITVALVGGFLLLFLLFHMLANLCILRNDNGLWYTLFCNFMGSNPVVKAVEILLFACLAIHIILTVWLTVTNLKARPIGYHRRSRSTTAPASKLMIWTGILILFGLLAHFGDFFFAKFDAPTFNEPVYIIDAKKLITDDVLMLRNAAAERGLTPDEFLNQYQANIEEFAATASHEELAELHMTTPSEYTDKLRLLIPVVQFLDQPHDILHTPKHHYIRNIAKTDRLKLQEAIEGLNFYPDFYTMARTTFASPYICIVYLIFFVVLFIHMRHAFSSAFQTLGLTNSRYFPVIDWLGIIYAIIILLGFSAIPITIYFFL